MKNLKGKVLRVRFKKQYKEATTHVMIGLVQSENAQYMIIEGKTFHFNRRENVSEGPLCLTVIPWNAVEVMHILSSKTDYLCNFTFDKDGNLALDNKHKTLIAGAGDFPK